MRTKSTKTKTAPKKSTAKIRADRTKTYEKILKAVTAGKPQAVTCRKYGVIPTTFAVWKSVQKNKGALGDLKNLKPTSQAGEARKLARSLLKLSRAHMNNMYRTPKAESKEMKRSRN